MIHVGCNTSRRLEARLACSQSAPCARLAGMLPIASHAARIAPQPRSCPGFDAQRMLARSRGSGVRGRSGEEGGTSSAADNVGWNTAVRKAHCLLGRGDCLQGASYIVVSK